MEGFLGYKFGGLIFGGAYTWMGLFSEFYGNITHSCYNKKFLPLLRKKRSVCSLAKTNIT